MEDYPKPPRWRQQQTWNRLRMEAKLAEDVEMRQLPNGKIVAFGLFKIRGSLSNLGGASLKRPLLTVWIMAINDAARFLAPGKRGQMCLVEGRLVSVPATGRSGKVWAMPRIIADFAQLGQSDTQQLRAAETQTEIGPVTVPEGAEAEMMAEAQKVLEAEFEVE